jgi:hypothetical protein
LKKWGKLFFRTSFKDTFRTASAQLATAMMTCPTVVLLGCTRKAGAFMSVSLLLTTACQSG